MDDFEKALYDLFKSCHLTSKFLIESSLVNRNNFVQLLDELENNISEVRRTWPKGQETADV